MRRVARVDANQRQIVETLRSHGCTVEHLHTIGKGVPDLLIGVNGNNYLLEVKDGSKSPSKRQLTPDEASWHKSWCGQVAVVNSVQEALEVILPICRGC